MGFLVNQQKGGRACARLSAGMVGKVKEEAGHQRNRDAQNLERNAAQIDDRDIGAGGFIVAGNRLCCITRQLIPLGNRML